MEKLHVKVCCFASAAYFAKLSLGESWASHALYEEVHYITTSIYDF